jgi:uncharacterized membrane protein
MESRAKLFGHPIHQMLILFPLGLFVTAIFFDILYFVSDNPRFAFVGYWNIAAGIVGGLAAAVFGLIDFSAVPRGTRAFRIGLAHGLGNVGLIALFVVAWLLRRPDALHLPIPTAFTLELVALGIGTVTAWLGGELVDRLGVGVYEGANLNASSSLSGRTANHR